MEEKITAAVVSVTREDMYDIELGEAWIEQDGELIWHGDIDPTGGDVDTYIPVLEARLAAAGHNPEELQIVTLHWEGVGIFGWMR